MEFNKSPGTPVKQKGGGGWRGCKKGKKEIKIQKKTRKNQKKKYGPQKPRIRRPGVIFVA